MALNYIGGRDDHLEAESSVGATGSGSMRLGWRVSAGKSLPVWRSRFLSVCLKVDSLVEPHDECDLALVVTIDRAVDRSRLGLSQPVNLQRSRPAFTMGFLKRILRSGVSDETLREISQGSFDALSDEELQTHMGINSYGVFDLTDAIRPSYDLQIVPRQGFRFDEYVDEASGSKTPVIMAAASRHRLMDLFLDLIEPLGSVVDVVLETSHRTQGCHEDLYREHIDMPVLKSILLEFEELLLNDGCTGIAVINPAKRQEVQLDEHKLLIVYGHPLKQYESVLIDGDVYPDKQLQFITEAEHVHSSSERLYDQFNVLRNRLGIDGEKYAGAW